MSTSITVYSASTDGHMYAGTDAHFSAARDATSADSIDASSTVARIGLDTLYSPDKYGFYRIGLAFDTSAIPDGATILSAALSLYLVYGLTIIPGGFQFVLMKMADNDGTYPHNPLVVGDYDRTLYVSGGASSPTIISGAGGYQTFTFNSTGCASWINDQGLSKFVVMTSLDIGYVVPNPGMLISVYTQERGAGYLPRLAITYAIIPTVTTNAATGVTSSGATGNGTIDSLQGESVISYGVIWNDDGTDPVDFQSADNYAAGSDLAAGDFSAAITGCDPETAYYYRAYAHTVAGYGVGSAVQFTTTVVLDVLSVRTDTPTAVAATTATFNGIVQEDAGHNLTAYGFVYKKGSDPGTPADPTDAEAYTDKGAKATPAEGAYSSNIVGLDGDSTYFLRAYVITSEDGTAYGSIEMARTGVTTETTFDGDTADGYAEYSPKISSITYTAAQALAITLAAPTADSVTTDSKIYADIGYTYWGDIDSHEFDVRRGYVYFDTSSIPSNATIISATLRLYVESKSAGGGTCGTLYVSSGMPTYPSAALTWGDYGISHYSEIASAAAADITAGAYNEISIPTANVTKEGTTKYCLTENLSGKAGNDPAGYRITDGEGANNPELVVTYSVPQTTVFPKVNLGDTWVQTLAAHVNMDDAWVELETPLANMADAWVEPTS